MDLLSSVYQAKDTEARRKAIRQGEVQPGLIDVYKGLKQIKQNPKPVIDYKKQYEKEKAVFETQKSNLEYIDKIKDLKLQREQLAIQEKWRRQEDSKLSKFKKLVFKK